MVINSTLNKLIRRENDETDTEFTFCDYLNVSACSATETSKTFIIAVYNPIARPTETNIRVPVSSKSVVVFDSDGKQISFSIQPVTKVTRIIRGKLGNASYELVFPVVNLPPLGLAMYQVNITSNSTKSKSNKVSFIAKSSGYIAIVNKHLRLTFSTMNGRLVEIENLDSQIKQSVDQQFLWYNSSVGNKVSDQASNAYIFRPNSGEPFNVSFDNHAKITIFKSSVVQEIHQVFSPWVSQIVRLYSNKPYAEFEYTIGPIKMSRELGKEVISRFDTNLKTNGIFYTDSNGREMQKRKRDFRPTWSYESELINYHIMCTA